MSEAAALIPTQGTDYTAALSAPSLPNLRRIGGEMFSWTDRDPRRGPEVPRGAVLRHLLGEHAGAGRSVLIAGPIADDLVIALVDAGATVTWLVRSLVDAEEAARAHPQVTVLAGAAVKVDPAERFDLVVAFDGVERLNSAEGDQLSAAELLDRLAEAVRPDGVLLLTHDNHLGVHHTVRLAPGGHQAQDADWYPLDENDPQRPASREQLVDRLTVAGLVVDVTYAAFPEPATPTVLVGPGLLGNLSAPLRPRLGTALNQAFAAAFRGRPVLSDPRRLVARALRAAAEETVAPAWLVIARASGSSAAAHDLLVGDSRGTFAYEVSATDTGEIRTTVLQPLTGPIEREGLRRIAEPAAPGTDAGYVLEERLLHLAATADLRHLRVELTQYETWLRAQAVDGRLAGPIALAGLADLLVTPDGPVLLPTRWEPIEPIDYETALTRALWEFAVQLITSGRSHPWPITSSAVDLTATLLGMTGRGMTDDQVRAAVELHITLEAAEHELTLEARDQRRLQLLAITPGTASVDIEGFRELTEALWRQRYEASHLLAMMEWTEQIIQSRDNTLSKLDREIQFYRKGFAGRVMVVGKEAYRAARRDGRKALRRLKNSS
ncbi:class I SAM-dependent methyltransferase [Actinoplanes subtropicus]|uniref:class I SAM-dependent methyltransferase n=1 Tax=Actinoplanes subtropicus TaxID=543632 RepID=UPI0004C3FAF1|nr:SAM-dependent methyltransferase [Actinoplanes subtropicus]